MLKPKARMELLAVDVLVEEKLDGMNVAVWIDDGVPHVGTRGGPDARDRSGERGYLKAWASTHVQALTAGLGDRLALYAEWLRRRHGVAYTHLPAEIIGIDVYDRREGEFLGVVERDAVLSKLGIAKPPPVYRGVLGSVTHLDSLLGTSEFAHERAEGLVVRATRDGARCVAKVVDPAWEGIGSLPWEGQNRLVV